MSGFGQRDTGKRFFLRNPYIVNPANAGYYDDFNLLFITDQSPAKIKSGSARYFGAVQYAMNKSNLGIGGTMDFFKRGMFETMEIDVALAYKLRLNKDLLASFGADVGLINNNYSVSNLNSQVNASDPTLYSDYYAGSNLKFGVGASMISYNLDMGLSFPRVFISGESLNLQSTFYASYGLELKERDVILKPAIYTNYYFGNVYNYEGSINLILQETFWLQLGYGARNWVHGGFGFSNKQIEIGYNFEMISVKNKQFLGAYHSLMVGYFLKGSRKLAFLRPLRFRNYSN